MPDICFCGKEKREDRLNCPRCFELYRKDAKIEKIPLMEWVQQKAMKKLVPTLASNIRELREIKKKHLKRKKENT